MKNIILAVFFIPFLSHGFIPPVGGVIKEIFDSRKPGTYLELSFKHEVELSQGSAVSVDETMIYAAGKAYFLWKTANHIPVYGTQDRKVFLVGADRKLATKSFAVVKYLSASSGEDFKEQLIAEQFIRRDQLLQYKPGFNFEGEPDSWQLQDNYIKHPDVQFKRLDSLVTIAVKGMEEGQNQKTVYFDNKQQGVRRLEWKEGNNISAWNFSDFNRYADGFLPKSMSFEQNGTQLITSELVQARGIKDKGFQNTLKAWQKNSRNAATGNLEEALRVLLSFR